MQRMGTFVEEMTKAGGVARTNGLHPSDKGKRIKLADGKMTMRLMGHSPNQGAGRLLCDLQVKTMDEAVMWSKRFLDSARQGRGRAASDLRSRRFLAGCVPPGTGRTRRRNAPRNGEKCRAAVTCRSDSGSLRGPGWKGGVSVAVTATDTHHAIHAVWRIEQAKLIAGLARFTRDVGMAEELAQDALVVALETWPKSGVPEKPGAWLMAIAKRRCCRSVPPHRACRIASTKRSGAIYKPRNWRSPDFDAALDDDINDDLLRLIFTACHPVLSIEAQVALTLRLLGGLTTDEIARAFLVPEPTIAQQHRACANAH